MWIKSCKNFGQNCQKLEKEIAEKLWKKLCKNWEENCERNCGKISKILGGKATTYLGVGSSYQCFAKNFKLNFKTVIEWSTWNATFHPCT